MKKTKEFLNLFEAIQKLCILIFLTFSIYKVTNIFTELPSFFTDFINVDLKEYDKPLIDETDETNLKIDSEEEETQIVLVDEDKSKITSNNSDNSKLYSILKLTGIIVGTLAVVVGIFYCINKLSSPIDELANVAQKGLDEANKATQEAATAASENLESQNELLENKRTELIKQVPKAKAKHFYRPRPME